MAECRGEPCSVITYTFTWDKVTVTKATANMKSGSPPRSSTADITGQLQGKGADWIQAAVQKKADDQAAVKDKNLRHQVKYGPPKAGGREYTLVDASCGPKGACFCDENEGAQGTPQKPMVKKFTITGLTEGADSFRTKTQICESFDIEITVTCTPTEFPGKCFGDEREEGY